MSTEKQLPPIGNTELTEDHKRLLTKNVQSWDIDSERMETHAAGVLERLQLAARMPREARTLARAIVDNNLQEIQKIYDARREALGNDIRKAATDMGGALAALERNRQGLRFAEHEREIQRILRFAQKIPEPGKEEGAKDTYLTRWNRRAALSPQLLADIALVEGMEKQYPKGSGEKAFLASMLTALKALREKDSTNANLSPVITKLAGGEKMILTIIGGLYAALRFAAAAKEGRLSISGVIVAALLLYMHSNPGTKLRFLSNSTFENLADKYGLRGADGAALADALMAERGKRAIQKFKERRAAVQSRTVKNPTDPKDQLIADLNFKKDTGPGKILSRMSAEEIFTIAQMFGSITESQEKQRALFFINPAPGVQGCGFNHLANLVMPGPGPAPAGAPPPGPGPMPGRPAEPPPAAPAEPVLPPEIPPARAPRGAPEPAPAKPRSATDEVIFKYFNDPNVTVENGIVTLPKAGRSPGIKGAMPEGILEIRGGLQFVNNAPIEMLPQSLKKINGSLDLGYSDQGIPNIPINLEITGNLFMDENPIAHPDIFNMRTHRILRALEDADARIGGKIYLRDVSENRFKDLVNAHPKWEDKLVREPEKK